MIVNIETNVSVLALTPLVMHCECDAWVNRHCLDYVKNMLAVEHKYLDVIIITMFWIV